MRYGKSLMLAGLAGGLALATSLSAGPLDPPSGPVAPTSKPLGEIEPRIAINSTNTPGDANSTFRITQPGSYYLTGNVHGVSGKHGIEVAAIGVTIDLNGFQMIGVAGSLDGINATGMDRLTVVNGKIVDWSGDGIEAGVTTAANCSFIDLCILSCEGNGIIAGDDSTLDSVVVANSSGTGFSLGASCIVRGCAAVGNQSNGFTMRSSCTFTDCSARINNGDGFHVETTGTAAAVIVNCSTQGNTGDGIEIGAESIVRGCMLSSSGLSSADGAGIHVLGNNNRIEGNNIASSDRGIDVDGLSNFICGNTCSANTINYSILAGNSFGPIISAGTNASAVNGSNAAGTLGSADPWANFSY